MVLLTANFELQKSGVCCICIHIESVRCGARCTSADSMHSALQSMDANSELIVIRCALSAWSLTRKRATGVVQTLDIGPPAHRVK